MLSASTILGYRDAPITQEQRILTPVRIGRIGEVVVSPIVSHLFQKVQPMATASRAGEFDCPGFQTRLLIHSPTQV